MGEAELKASLDRLFAAPLGDFIALRKSLARELRDQGHAGPAAVLAAAHKPTASAWALNQVVREHKDVIGRFLAAAGAARGAQRDVKKLREAMRTLSALSAEVVQLAKGALDAAGVGASPIYVARVEGTLRTVPLASDEDRERLALGHLSHDLDLSGDIGAFGEGGESPEDTEPSAGAVQARSTPAVASLDDARKAKAKAKAERDERVEREERDRAERAARERAARAADQEARRLEARADEANAQLASLRQQAEAASRAAQEAGARVEAASREASAARDEARQARTRAEQARRLSEK